MQDTDWRPTPCPHCGTMREAIQYPVCENAFCHYFGLLGDEAVKKTERTMKTEQKYVWLSERAPVIINSSELELVYKDTRYNADNDKIFELGAEVKIKMQIVAIPAHPITRGQS